MRELPALFKGQMVRGLLDDSKGVTRRVMGPPPVLEDRFWRFGGAGWSDRITSVTPVAGHTLAEACPYGRPGDRLWVREAWAADAQLDSIAPRDLSQGEPIFYPADGAVRQAGCAMINRGRLRPSIHMPRWVSRILLEVTAVRVERLQDITEAQAIAEGILRDGEGWRGYEGGPWFASPIAAFRSLWEHINGAGSWDANPWVWVVEFKRIQP